MRIPIKPPIYVLVAAGFLACGHTNYIYTPTTANAGSGGLPAERTPIPQERPQGAVEVTSYGVTDLQPADARVAALHVRMIVTNDGDDAAWRLDTRRQLAEIPGEGRSAPIYVNADTNTLPDVTIGLHERRVLDLYYPLPATIRDDGQLPRFEMLWQVTTTSRVVASRTSFDRVALEPKVANGYYTTWPLWGGYGPYWWYDPFYGRVVFVHSRPIVISDYRAPVVRRFKGSLRTGGGPYVARGVRRR